MLKKLCLRFLLNLIPLNDRYVGLCISIKALALALFILDWWLIRRRKHLEQAATVLPVHPLVHTGSIISLDKRKLSTSSVIYLIRYHYLEFSFMQVHFFFKRKSKASQTKMHIFLPLYLVFDFFDW